MKTLFMRSTLFIAFCLLAFSASAQKQKIATSPDPAMPVKTVEVACGQCMFKLPGNDCDLAVRIDQNAFYVDGTKIDDHGDAHADDGFCNAVRKAEVQGVLENDRFKVTYFKLLPLVKD